MSSHDFADSNNPYDFLRQTRKKLRNKLDSDCAPKVSREAPKNRTQPQLPTSRQFYQPSRALPAQSIFLPKQESPDIAEETVEVTEKPNMTADRLFEFYFPNGIQPSDRDWALSVLQAIQEDPRIMIDMGSSWIIRKGRAMEISIPEDSQALIRKLQKALENR